MARLQAGNAELDLAQTDISQLITEAAGQFWSIDSGKTIQTDVSSDLPKVRIDRSLIMRALENLIDNAEKYSPKGTPVEISAQGKNHGVEIVVRDHGKGIPQGIKAFAAEVAAGEATSAPPAEGGAWARPGTRDRRGASREGVRREYAGRRRGGETLASGAGA